MASGTFSFFSLISMTGKRYGFSGPNRFILAPWRESAWLVIIGRRWWCPPHARLETRQRAQVARRQAVPPRCPTPASTSGQWKSFFQSNRKAPFSPDLLSVIDADLRTTFWGNFGANISREIANFSSLAPSALAKSLQFIGGERTKNESFVRKRSWCILSIFWKKPITTALSVRWANRKTCSAMAWWVALMLRDRDRVKNVFSHLQNPNPRGKMQTRACGACVGVHATEHVRMQGNGALEYLKIINFTQISTHGPFIVYPFRWARGLRETTDTALSTCVNFRRYLCLWRRHNSVSRAEL